MSNIKRHINQQNLKIVEVHFVNLNNIHPFEVVDRVVKIPIGA